MTIAVNDVPFINQPVACNWEPPPLISKDGNGAPILAPYWKCRLSLSVLTSVKHDEYFTLRGGLHTFRLPHPYDGTFQEYSVYVDNVVGRMITKKPDCPAMAGLDMELSRITI